MSIVDHHDEMRGCSGDREDRKAGAAGHPDRGGHPHDRSCGQAAHGIAAHEDQSAAD